MAVGAGLVLSGTAFAQSRLDPQTFLEQANGHTLTFTGRQSGSVVGVEQFLSTTRSVWADESGRCTYGVIEVRGPYLCFIYEDFPDPLNCWATFTHQGDLLVMSTSSRQIQRITAVTDTPVICSDVPMS